MFGVMTAGEKTMMVIVIVAVVGLAIGAVRWLSRR
jgi:cell division protein FtsL